MILDKSKHKHSTRYDDKGKLKEYIRHLIPELPAFIHNQDIDFISTGGWSGCAYYREKTINVNIPTGATIRLVCDGGIELVLQYLAQECKY